MTVSLCDENLNQLKILKFESIAMANRLSTFEIFSPVGAVSAAAGCRPCPATRACPATPA